MENEKLGVCMMCFFFYVNDWSKCLVSLKVCKLHAKGQPSVTCMSVHQ